MGVMGELFPGQKPADESSKDSAGLPHRPRFDIDLDSGVAVVPQSRAARDEPAADDER